MEKLNHFSMRSSLSLRKSFSLSMKAQMGMIVHEISSHNVVDTSLGIWNHLASLQNILK